MFSLTSQAPPMDSHIAAYPLHHTSRNQCREPSQTVNASRSLHTNNSTPVPSSDDDTSDSAHSACSMHSTQQLQPRLPITYNEAALTRLHGRLQIWTLNCTSIPLPPSSNEESPTTDSNNVQEELPSLMDSDLNYPEA